MGRGLCIGVHRTIASHPDYCKELKTNCDDIQALSVTMTPGENGEIVTFINVYDSPEHSSFKSKVKKNGDLEVTTL